ncbi:MAG: TolC family protein [Chitinophagaceae bacterium]|nr:TolC family protein [Chitinophagaceae bacterium]
MKIKHIIISCLLFAADRLMAQDKPVLTLEQCYTLASTVSPLAEQKALTIRAGNMAEKNQNLKWLPQVDLNAQATYQSAVTSFPAKLPNVTVEELSKDQYKGTLDILQPVYDGGVISTQKKLQHATTNVESQRVEVDLFQLRSKVNGYFFTAILMEENIRVMNLVKDDLDNNIKKLTAQAANGIATNSNVDVLKAELLKTSQKIIEYNAARKAAIQMLEILTGTAIAESTSFVKPAGAANTDEAVSDRPELKLFDFQKQQFQLQSKLIGARSNPRFSFFANGGYGKPGLNMLKNEFQWFYTGGVRLSIPITGQFTKQRDQRVIKIQEQIVERQKENFLNNNRQLLVQQKNEVEKYKQLVATDAEIVALRTKIKENASFRLANGIITSSDYITELNAESQAMLTQKLHEIQWLQSQYNYKLILGK